MLDRVVTMLILYIGLRAEDDGDILNHCSNRMKLHKIKTTKKFT